MVGGSNRGRPRRKPGATRGRGRPPRDGRAKPPNLTACFITRCDQILDRLKKKDHYNIFLEPVDPNVVADYDTIVKTPMAISIMSNKLHSHQYKSLGEFRRDLDLMWDNCLLFNGTEPNNIFSKKAIELQKVTEKLIAAARQELERDKEEINLWKEKHRRNKPANPGEPKPDPAQEALLSTSTELPRDNNANQNSASGTAHRTDNRINPRAAYEYAMRQLLRAQYGDNTGLHKRNIEDNTPQHYMTPEGTPVQLGSVRYNPYENRWFEFDDIRRRPDVSPMNGNNDNSIYNRIPQSSQPNECSPLEQREFVNVKAYVESLQAYVKDAGEIPSRIIAEFLGPELALRDTMEKRKRRKLDPSAAGDSSNTGNDNGNSDGDGSVKRKDPLIAACRQTLLNNPPKKIPEFEGEEGLTKFMSAELAEQVKNVPVSVIDFATPYGVCAASLAEVVHLAKIPGALNVDPIHVRNLEEIHKATADFAARQDPRAVAAMGGASSLSPAQIHDFQLKLTQSIEVLTRVMPDRKVIPRNINSNNNGSNNHISGINMNPMNPAAGVNGENAQRRIDGLNAKSRNANIDINRGGSSLGAYANNNHPTPNRMMPNKMQSSQTAPAPLANVLGPMGNLAPLHGHPQRRPNPNPGNNVNINNNLHMHRPTMNNLGGHFFNNQAQAAPTAAHTMKALPIPNHPNNHPNNPVNRQQNTQNGINPAMHALMNPTPTPVSQSQRIHQQQRQLTQQRQLPEQQQQAGLRPLANSFNMPLQSSSAAAARLASMGMMINPVNASAAKNNNNNNQPDGNVNNRNVATLSTNNKTGSVLSGILPDIQQHQNVNIAHHPNVNNGNDNSNVQRLAHLQMSNPLLNSNTNAPASAPMHMGRQQVHPASQSQAQNQLGPPSSLIAGNQATPAPLIAGNQQQHALARNMGNIMGNLANLPSRNANLLPQSQSLAVRNNNPGAHSQPQSQAPPINHFHIRHQNNNNIGAFGNDNINTIQQAGMTAARAPATVSAPELSMPIAAPVPVSAALPASVSAPLQFPATNVVPGGDTVSGNDPLLAPIFGTNDNITTPAGAPNPSNNGNAVPPGTIPGATNNGNTDSPQLDSIFSFDGALEDGGGTAADFGF